MIAEFAMQTGIAPAQSWLDWLSVANGADLSSADYWLSHCTGLTRYPTRLPDARWHLARYPEWRSRGWIPIADDGCGDYFLLGQPFQGGPSDAVMFWDQATPAEAGIDYVISSDLWTFIVGVLELRGGPTNWPFNDTHLLEFDPQMRSVPHHLRPSGDELRRDPVG